MNKLLLLFATFTTLTAQSQTTVYHPFPTGNANWVYQYYNEFHIPTAQFTAYSFNGDTIISTITYKKVFMNSTYSGALRESNKIIYFVPDTSFTEYLLYDFNLGVGDTLINPYGGAVCANDTAIVVQVDSILTSDGYHRQLHFNSDAYWIEGIGAINYLLNPCNVLCISGNDFITCLSTDATFNYPSGISSCFVSVDEQSKLINEISITPNPFQTFALLKLGSEFENADLIIYNSIGLIIRKEKIIRQLTYQLNRKELPNGIYLIKLINEKGQEANGKIIID
jgi:hypothetical protein